MAAYTSTHRYHDMILFLLGLYFCVAINPVESLDLNPSFEITERYTDMENCTQCLIKSHSDCSCQKYVVTNECLICCPEFSCCLCSDCTLCWRNQQKTISLYQINIYILCGYSIICLIVIYYKICKKIKERLTWTSMRRTFLQRDSDTSNSNTNEIVQERPPSYNEVCGAPPLYTSPYNMTFMEEAPPRYPGTPKLQERSRDSNEPPATFSITQHM